jgi:hypothetical protein
MWPISDTIIRLVFVMCPGNQLSLSICTAHTSSGKYFRSSGMHQEAFISVFALHDEFSNSIA